MQVAPPIALVQNGDMEVNASFAQKHLRTLIEKARLGEEIVIARAGKPVAKLVGFRPGQVRRKLGSATGTIRFRRGWDAPMTKAELEKFLSG